MGRSALPDNCGGGSQRVRVEGEGNRAKRNIENENKEYYELCQARTKGGQDRAGQARSGQASFAKPLLKVIGKAVH